MAKKRKILEKILTGSKNVRFNEFVTLVKAFGFVFQRTRGSHEMYFHSTARALLNIQPNKDGTAKPYQMKQFLDMVEQHNLKLDEDGEA